MTALYIALATLGALALAAIVSYNRFVSQRAGIAASWGGVDAELQRRHDLIPNLVEVVRGYAAHEQSVLTQVAEARARAVALDRDPNASPDAQAPAENQLTGALRSLFAVAENYPELKASTHFLDLQAQLVETEDRIAAARRLYNIEVMGYNRRIEAFPSNVVASAANFERHAFFELEDRSMARPPATTF